MYDICTNFLKLCKGKSFFEMNQEKCSNYLLLCTSLIQLYRYTVGLLPQTDVAIVFCSGFRLHFLVHLERIEVIGQPQKQFSCFSFAVVL